MSAPGRLRKRPQVFQTRAYFWTFFFIFGNQQTRSSDRSATPLRPFLRCRDLGIDRWPHRKLQSLSNLYVDLKAHMDRCEKDSAKRHHYCNDMAVIKAYSIRLESDLSLLNQFYNGKKAWPQDSQDSSDHLQETPREGSQREEEKAVARGQAVPKGGAARRQVRGERLGG